MGHAQREDSAGHGGDHRERRQRDCDQLAVHGSAPGAAPALSVDHEVVTAHRVLQVARQPLELLLQPLVVKRRYPPAAVADGVVMMLTPWGDRLEACAGSAEVDPLHEPHVME
jgi:hypothetical protein